MSNFETTNNKREYPPKSTPRNLDVYTLGSEHLDLYFIRNFVTELPPEEIPLNSLLPQLESQSWEEPEANSPLEVLHEYNRLSEDTSEVLAEHPEWTDRLKRIEEADYAYPILIYKGVIIDGLHRVIHAAMDKRQTISAHVLTTLPSEAYFEASE